MHNSWHRTTGALIFHCHFFPHLASSSNQYAFIGVVPSIASTYGTVFNRAFAFRRTFAFWVTSGETTPGAVLTRSTRTWKYDETWKTNWRRHYWLFWSQSYTGHLQPVKSYSVFRRGDLKKKNSFIPLISNPINKIFPYFYEGTPQVNKVFFSQFCRVIIDFLYAKSLVAVFYERYSKAKQRKDSNSLPCISPASL